MASTPVLLDRLTWSRWWRTVRAFATSEVGGRAGAFLAMLLGFLLAMNGLNVVNSYVGRDFMTEIEHRSMPGFVRQALLYVGVFAVSTLLAVFYRFAEERLGLLWREWLTRRALRLYMSDAAYLRLRETNEVANPDQRIADDIRTFTTMTLSLTLVLLNSTFTLVAFAGVMWSISPKLFAVAAAYAALGSGLTILLGRPLIWLNYNQADREASLRAELVHVRENAESIALLGREARLRSRVLNRLEELVGNLTRIIAVNRNLGFFTTGYNYLIQIIPALIVAPLFIHGRAEFGVISQSAMAFTHLVGAFSVIISQFGSISAYAVVLARLGALTEAMEQAAAHGARSRIDLDESGTSVSYQALTLVSPRDAGVLLEDLTFSVPAGTRALVSGPNEAARLALFRATAGLFDTGSGHIVRPPPELIRYLPERPYLPPGTLRQALVRSGREHEVDEGRLRELLGTLGAEGVLAQAGGLDVERDWDDLLSLGEQQLVSFARIALLPPTFALLDRPTTTLPAETIDRALSLLAARSITVITFAADRALAAQHDVCLTLAADGTWTSERLR